MRVVLQRVSAASVTIAGEVTGRIGAGLMILVGIESADTADDGEWLAGKISKLRLFTDADGKMNLSLLDLAAAESSSPITKQSDEPRPSPQDGGGRPLILLVSQFTLHASTAKGTRPSFNAAARPEQAQPLYDRFIRQLENASGRPVATGKFGAMMEVGITNNGPVTLILDSKSRV